jgi:citrate lyase beta subunit
MVYRLGTDKRSYETARGVAADALLFDLEDSVDPVDKPAARIRLLDALAAGGFSAQERIVRINALETLWGADDIAALTRAPLDGIMLAKAEAPSSCAPPMRRCRTMARRRRSACGPWSRRRKECSRPPRSPHRRRA